MLIFDAKVQNLSEKYKNIVNNNSATRIVERYDVVLMKWKL